MSGNRQLLKRLNEEPTKVSGLTRVGGGSHAEVGSGPTKVLTASNNTNGAIIRYGWVWQTGAANNANAEIRIDSNAVLVIDSRIQQFATIRDIFVPAGQYIELDAGSKAGTAIFYKVL